MGYFVYSGSDRKNHMAIVTLGCQLGIQHIRKMTIGEKIAEMANEGNAKAIKICESNPQFFYQPK